jgi:protein-S-isoprenylcysteine O-methyltransferase Ste14
VRWVVFILLLLGALFSLTAFAPAAAGKAALLWPFAADSRPIISFVGGLPGQSGSVVTSFLAGVAGAVFVTAAVGLFWKAISIWAWTALVVIAAITSFLLYASYFGSWMIAPILVDAALLWGVLTKRWSAEVVRMRTIQNAPAPTVHPLMHIPVPWVYVLAFLAGVGLQYLVPLGIYSARVLLASQIAGIVLIVGGTLLIFSSLGIFRAARTTTVPFEAPAKLVTWGPYRYTRNPMYVGLALLYIGVAEIEAQIWPLLLLPLLMGYIHKVVIPIEEANLQRVFGDTYLHYCAAVRRWL